MFRLLSLLALSCLTSACVTNHLVKKPDGSADAPIERTHRIAIFGLWEIDDPIDLKKACEGRDWHRLQTGFSAMNVLVGFVTVGLYTPATVKISCEARN